MNEEEIWTEFATGIVCLVVTLIFYVKMSNAYRIDWNSKTIEEDKGADDE